MALAPLNFFANATDAQHIAAQVALSGQGALLGVFIHSSNWDAQAFENLLQAASQYQLDIDLHIDEELNSSAQGMRWLARYLRESPLKGRSPAATAVRFLCRMMRNRSLMCWHSSASR
ncbi:hypothetical protein O3W44_24565 [Pantoea sp. LMR881]|uniref:hypothetical protein n=1 Tax=Pantoea sp. LMR881 TaxID=3014336 RepID=UPI0022AE818A|nr:hypothetical protein [Pantoea sp. LMR881]MCZ4061627.1 hypothetical protein [Pantoea sp. LMR881]